jgi:hypothetical protein
MTLATLCSFCILQGVGGSQSAFTGEDFLFLIPAPIAALLALSIHSKSIHEHLREEIATILMEDQDS